MLVATRVVYAEMHPIECDPILHPYVNRICQLPAARQLIEKVQQQGDFCILVNRSYITENFGALWDTEHRVIALNLPSQVSEGRVMASIIFELHNASRNLDIQKYENLAAQGCISRHQYVEAIERIEYENSHNARRLTDEGINKGFYPQDARKGIYDSFEEHFYWQNVSGHSECIAQVYDSIVG